MNSITCPLCGSPAKEYHRDKTREYFQCLECELVSVEPGAHLSESEEKSRYDLHENSPDDAGYRRFLSRMLDPIVERVPGGSRGLDFGSGPGPTLSVMFEELGYPMAVYDPLYAPDKSVLEIEYDFVTATEVVEHMGDPASGLARMWGCVRPGGILGIMTKLVTGPQAFANWHYKNDDTHVCFFSKTTIEWLCRRWGTEPVFVGSDVIICPKKQRCQR